VQVERLGHVSYGRLALIGLAFVGGGAFVLLLQNVLARETISFSTPDLLGFLFGVAVAAASTVLAIAAILLGKSSEYAMIQRSDESIRLQNEVFVKTTDALARIESSTGVTEKRIEDIISGRAGEVSQAIAERITTEGGRVGSRATLANEIRESLLKEFSRTTTLDMREQQKREAKEAEEAEEKYRRFQASTLAEIANSRTVTCEKIGDGTYTSKGLDLFDGVFVDNGKRIGVSMFSSTKTAPDRFEHFVVASAEEIRPSAFASVSILFDGEIAPDSPYRKRFDNVTAILKPEVANRLMLFDGPNGSAAQKLLDYLKAKNKVEAPLKIAAS